MILPALSIAVGDEGDIEWEIKQRVSYHYNIITVEIIQRHHAGKTSTSIIAIRCVDQSSWATVEKPRTQRIY